MKKIEELTDGEQDALSEEMVILRDWLDDFDGMEKGAHNLEVEEIANEIYV